MNPIRKRCYAIFAIDAKMGNIIRSETHRRIVIKYKTTKYNFSILIFQFLIFLCLLHVLNPRVHLQEVGCKHRYGIACFSM